MIRSIKVVAASLGVALAAAGCGSFLTGEKLSSDPNQPSSATRDQLFVGVQANLFSSQENSVAMTVCMWMQQCAGVGGRFVEQYSRYVVDEFSWDGNWFNVYTGGGLIDLRKIEASARADGDSVYLGIAKIWEAFDIGTAADLWGDIPYSDAVGSDATPTLDSQAAVYDSVQALLSQAIVELGGPGGGPGPLDRSGEHPEGAVLPAHGRSRGEQGRGIRQRYHGGHVRHRGHGGGLEDVPYVGDLRTQHLVPVPAHHLRSGRGRGEVPRGSHEGAQRSAPAAVLRKKQGRRVRRSRHERVSAE